MNIIPIHTEQIVVGATLVDILDRHITKLPEKSILAITSKIVSICQNRVLKISSFEDKVNLIKKEAQYTFDDERTRRYGMLLTVTSNILIPNAGIDESNSNGYAILWPTDPMNEAKNAWVFLRKKFSVKHLGIIITDSHTTPLRWGTTGIGIAWCGITALKNYIGTPDIFGRLLKVTRSNVLDGLASAAVGVMGEGNEQTPMALITDAHHVIFLEVPPTPEEQKSLIVPLDDDLYAPILSSVKWKKKLV